MTKLDRLLEKHEKYLNAQMESQEECEDYFKDKAEIESHLEKWNTLSENTMSYNTEYGTEITQLDKFVSNYINLQSQITTLTNENKELEKSKNFYLNKYAECEGIIEEIKIDKDTKIKQLTNEKKQLEEELEKQKKYEKILTGSHNIYKKELKQYKKEKKQLEFNFKNAQEIIKTQENWIEELNHLVSEIEELWDKILDMNPEDYLHYARTELRNGKELLQKYKESKE